ncbi:phthalate transporter-like protein [Bimuria novae-zelandiae CBS 107.79]|uniref:Phthalate transporter-like protein n=1 Tax=Bimuria novae-zelandiae CBS 107.79 TaxID=1447943 RepID=A0A6A5VFR4_9PLEO|nr:phthalate transporter-like protein [Bimuria novae-zelandiae CBS 107.79]
MPKPSTTLRKKLVRKIDWRLLPILGALYSISLIFNARVAGMGQDLALNVGDRYTIALVVFFPTYFLFELPSNIVLHKVGSANWLAFIALSWGAVMIGQGFVTNWQTLAVCRALLGFFEAGFFPGCMQKRLGGIYLVAVGVGGIANILAYGIMQMEGVGGLRGWQWIFVLEGILTCVVAIWAWWLILDFPDKAAKQGFLTEHQADWVLRRIEEDRGDSEADPLTWAKFFKHPGDLKLWAFCTLFMSTTVPVYAFSYFTPVILLGMGYSAGVANALTAPPAIVAMITAFAWAWIGDKYTIRPPIIAIQSIICLVGLMLVAYVKNNGVRYFGLFLGIMGCQGNVPAILTYQANNIRMQSKRSVASALQIGFGAIGGIVASTVFRQRDAPEYVFYTLAVLVATSLYFRRMNKKADRQLAAGETVDPIEGQVGFRYTI